MEKAISKSPCSIHTFLSNNYWIRPDPPRKWCRIGKDAMKPAKFNYRDGVTTESYLDLGRVWQVSFSACTRGHARQERSIRDRDMIPCWSPSRWFNSACWIGVRVPLKLSQPARITSQKNITNVLQNCIVITVEFCLSGPEETGHCSIVERFLQLAGVRSRTSLITITKCETEINFKVSLLRVRRRMIGIFVELLSQFSNLFKNKNIMADLLSGSCLKIIIMKNSPKKNRTVQ